MSRPYKKSKQSETIAFKCEEELKTRLENVLENTHHEDMSQLMRYIVQMQLPLIEKQIQKEKEKQKWDSLFQLLQ